MKFSATVGQLRAAFDQVTRVVPRVPSQAVYGGVRLRVRDGEVTITASDEGHTTITATVDASATQNGTKVLLAKPIQTFLSTLPHAKLVHVATANGPELTVTPEGSTPYKFRLMEASFPNTTPPTATLHDVTLDHLGLAVKAIKASVNRDKVVQLVSEENRLLLHTTDNLRLARAELPGVTLGTLNGLIPLPVLEQLADQSVTTCGMDDRARVFIAATPSLKIVTRLINEIFPDVNNLLEASQPHSIEIPSKPTLQALTRLLAVADQRPAVITAAGDQLTLSTDSASLGSGTETLELATPTSSEITFAINAEFFKDALAAHSSSTLTLGWESPVHPIYLTSTNPIPITTVVMPVRLA